MKRILKDFLFFQILFLHQSRLQKMDITRNGEKISRFKMNSKILKIGHEIRALKNFFK